ncbi:MAG: GAF domain-containing protein [Oscillochloridaceae bacterium umkhey_bin13]
MGLPQSDIWRISAFAIAAGLALGVLLVGMLSLLGGGPALPWPEAVLLGLVSGLVIGLALVAAIRIALRHTAHELHHYAQKLTDAYLPPPAALRGDELATMRTTIREAVAAVPRPEDLPLLARDLVAASDAMQALDLAALRLATHLPIQGAVLLTLDPEREVLLPAATWGLASLAPGLALDLDATAIGRALREQRASEYSGLQVRELLPLQRGPEALTLFCLPLLVEGRPFGTLCLLAAGDEVRLSDAQRDFARGVADLLTLATQSGIHRRLLAREVERLGGFEQIGHLLSGGERIERALEQVLRVAAHITDSPHGSLLLLDPDESEVRVKITLEEHQVLPISIATGPILRHGLAGWVLRERRADLIEDTTRDARWLPVPGLNEMRSAQIAPLLYGERVLGLLTLAHPHPHHYSPRSLTLTSALAAYAVTVMARLPYEELTAPSHVALGRRLLEPHVPASSLMALLADPEAVARTLEPRRRDVVALWVGLRGLDSLGAQVAPDQVLSQVLSPYLDLLGMIAETHHAYVCPRDAGEVVLIFGFPAAPGDPRVRALHAAQDLQREAPRLRLRWRNQFRAELSLSAGLAAGPVICGVIGERTLRMLTLLGDAVRDAGLIQGLARPDEVLVAASLVDQLGHELGVPFEPLAPLSLDDLSMPRPIFKLVPATS